LHTERPERFIWVYNRAIEAIEHTWTEYVCAQIQGPGIGNGEKWQRFLNIVKKTFCPITQEWIPRFISIGATKIKPPSFKSRNLMKTCYNALASVIPISQNEDGSAAWVDPEQAISRKIRQEKENLTPPAQNGAPYKVDCEITGDAANMQRGVKHTQIAFKLVNTKSKLECSPAGTHGLILTEGPDNYDTFKPHMESYPPFIKKASTVGLIIDNMIFVLRFFLGGDLPFLASMLGHVGHMHTFCCIWCYIKLNQLAEVGLNATGQHHVIR
jgi:hypothetical protein